MEGKVGKVSPGSLRANKTREWARASGDPPSMRRSDTVSTEDKEEEDGENKNYGGRKSFGEEGRQRERP